MRKIFLTCCVLFSAMTFSSILLAQGFFKIQAPVLPIPKASDLKNDQLFEIGIKIWQNECGVWDHPGKVTHDMKKSVTDWEENYAQIGIVQSIWYPSIWYPADENKKFQEYWPRIAQDLKDKGYPIEDWMLGACPWNNSEEFFAHFDGDRLKSLRKMLAKKAIIIEQARCIAERLDASLDKMKVAIDAETQITQYEKGELKRIVIENFYKVATEDYPRGLYALMDYVQFKGEGVLLTETINRVGWGDKVFGCGLLQVLEQMNDRTIAQDGADGAIAAFFDAAVDMFPTNEYFKTRMETYLSFNPDKIK